VRGLGSRAEPLVPDLKRIMSADHLLDRKVRLYLAFALTGFDSHRQAAEAYLEKAQEPGSIQSAKYIRLAQTLLQRIRGPQESDVPPIVGFGFF
jgi:hypothetical protein